MDNLVYTYIVHWMGLTLEKEYIGFVMRRSYCRHGVYTVNSEMFTRT